MIQAKIFLGFRAMSSLHFWHPHFLLQLVLTAHSGTLTHSRYDNKRDICNTEHTLPYRKEVAANAENWHLCLLHGQVKCKRCRKISGVFKCCAATFPLFSSYRCRKHRGRYFDEGMSQKDSRDDSKGPPSTQKLNYLHSHFERGDSQHKNLPINSRNLPTDLLRSFISRYIFKYFDEGMPQKDSRDDSKGPASTQ